MKLERREGVSVDEFIAQYLVPNRPVVITGATDTWQARQWTPESLARDFSGQSVQVYNDLFDLIDVSTLDRYVRQHCGKSGDLRPPVPYVRWYAKLKDLDFAWADEVFARIRDQWSLPSFLPTTSYLLPYTPHNGSRSPVDDPFPAKGLFLSARGARTRLHRDPWGSDAMICQVYGEKSVTLYPPDQAECLCRGQAFVDIEAPDTEAFPRFSEARPAVQDTLTAGEVIYVPAGWFHHVVTVSDSISLTWNFVHASACRPFLEYLASGPPADEMDVVRLFLRP